MSIERKQQAKNLFFQSELTKTQIAGLLGISRRSITYWVKEGNWNRLKESATHLPSILAENCYHIFGHLTEHYLSERRLTNPVSYKEIDGLHKLASTIGKLKNRSTVNESMEMFGFFVDMLKKRNPQMAKDIAPYVDEYISGRAAIYTADLIPENFAGVGGRIPWKEEDITEQQLDAREEFFSDPETIKTYNDAGIPLPTDKELQTLPDPTPAPPTYTIGQRNQECLDECKRYRLNLLANAQSSQQDALKSATLAQQSAKVGQQSQAPISITDSFSTSNKIEKVPQKNIRKLAQKESTRHRRYKKRALR